MACSSPEASGPVDEHVGGGGAFARDRGRAVLVVGDVQGGDRLPHVAEGGVPVLLGQPGKQHLAGQRRGDGVEEADRPAGVGVAQVGHGTARCQLVEQVHRDAGPAERGDRLLELAGDVGHGGHPVADERRPRRLLREVGEVGQRLGHELAADQQRRPGQLLVARGPERRARSRPRVAAAGCRPPAGRARRGRCGSARASAAPTAPGSRRAAHSPTTAAAGRSAISRSKSASHSGKRSACPSAAGHSSSLSGRSAGAGASSRRTRYCSTQPAMASWRPRCASASAAMGPWLARPSGP